MCKRGLQSQCETTQNRDTGFGGSLFGYTQLYGNVPGLQAQAARVPLADYTLIKVGTGAEAVAGLETSTVTPGNTAPDASFALPAIVPST